MSLRRLAFAIDQSGGNATYMANLAHALSSHSDLAATFHGVKIVDYDVWELIPGVRANYALAASARAAAALHAARRRVERLDAAFIHSQSIALFSIPFMHSVPTVISSDGTPKNYDTFADQLGHKVYGPRIELAKSLWTRATIRSARKLLAFSSWVKDSFINDYGADPSRVVVIPSGVNTELWKPKPERRQQNDRIKILFTGALFENKGGPWLLEWLRSTRHRQVELHLVTKHPLPPEPRVFVHNDLTANSEALISLAQSCDLFALPTRGDCFPFAAIEAQSAGLPAIVSDVGGMREIVVEGETGYLCDRNDKTGYFERLDRLVGDASLRARMSSSSRARAATRFDAKKNSARVLELLLSVADSPN